MDGNRRWDVAMRKALDGLLPVYLWNRDSRSEAIQQAVAEWDEVNSSVALSDAATQAEVPASVRPAAVKMVRSVMDGREGAHSLIDNVHKIVAALMKHCETLDEADQPQPEEDHLQPQAGLIEALNRYLTASGSEAIDIDPYLTLWKKFQHPEEWTQVTIRAAHPDTGIISRRDMSPEALALLATAEESYESSLEPQRARMREVLQFATPGEIKKGELKQETAGLICLAWTDFILQYCRFWWESASTGRSDEINKDITWLTLSESAWDMDTKYQTRILRNDREQVDNGPFKNFNVLNLSRLTSVIQTIAHFPRPEAGNDQVWLDIDTVAADNEDESQPVALDLLFLKPVMAL